MTEGNSPARWDQAVFDGTSIRVTLPRTYLGNELWLTDRNVRQVMPNMPFAEAFKACIIALFTSCAVDFVYLQGDQLYLRPPHTHPTERTRLSAIQQIELFRLGLQAATGQSISPLHPQAIVQIGDGSEIAIGATGLNIAQIIEALCLD